MIKIENYFNISQVSLEVVKHLVSEMYACSKCGDTPREALTCPKCPNVYCTTCGVSQCQNSNCLQVELITIGQRERKIVNSLWSLTA